MQVQVNFVIARRILLDNENELLFALLFNENKESLMNLDAGSIRFVFQLKFQLKSVGVIRFKQLAQRRRVLNPDWKDKLKQELHVFEETYL